MKEFQIDCSKFCGYVKVDENETIIEAMFIIKIFIGQPLSNLTNWVSKKFGTYTLKEIK
jgi:hypothetical protein